MGLAASCSLVGRGREVRRIRSMIVDQGRQGLVLAGEAGVGKTRLATECVAVAEAETGMPVIRAIATRSASTITFGALAPLLPDLEPDGRGVGALRQSVEALHRLVTPASGARGLLLIDDAHLLDDASATVVHLLATTTDVFVLATVRAGAPCPDPISLLWKDGIAERLDLGPLDRAGAELLVAGLLGGVVDGHTAHQLWDRTGGNPLFLRELVLGGLAAGVLDDQDGVWRLRVGLVASARLIELVEARLADLAPDERVALEIVALGEPVGLAVLTTLTHRRHVEALERRSLVTVDLSDLRRDVRLAHPLHGDVLRAQMATLRSMAVYRRLHEAIGRTGTRRREDLLRVAVWGLESDGPLRADLTLAAARAAHHAHDDHLALRLAEAAVHAGAGTEGSQLLGEVLADLGRHADAEAVLSAAARTATTEGERATVALTLATLLFWGLDRPDDANRVLLEAEDQVAASDWRDEMAAERAAFAQLRGCPREALAIAEPILRRCAGRPFVEAAIAAGPALAVMGRSAEAIALAGRAFEVHVALGDVAIMTSPGIHLVTRCFALGEAGDLVAAEAEAVAGYDAAVSIGAVDGQAWFALVLGRSLLLRRPSDAERWFRLARGCFAEVGLHGPQRWCLAGAALSCATRGDQGRASELLAAEASLGARHMRLVESDIVRARAWVAVAAGDLDGAEAILVEACRVAAESGAHGLESAAAHDRVRIGRGCDVVARLDELAGLVDGDLAATRAAHAVAAVAGHPAELGAVAERFATAGADVLAAEAAAQASIAHRRRGDRRAAERLARRARQLGEASGGVMTPGADLAGAAAGLTPREAEVARLAAQGRSNKEIASHLGLSARTVGNHLQRTYDKLGIPGREGLRDALAPA